MFQTGWMVVYKHGYWQDQSGSLITITIVQWLSEQKNSSLTNPGHRTMFTAIYTLQEHAVREKILHNAYKQTHDKRESSFSYHNQILFSWFCWQLLQELLKLLYLLITREEHIWQRWNRCIHLAYEHLFILNWIFKLPITWAACRLS